MRVNQVGRDMDERAVGLTGAVAVDGVLAKHVELSVFGDDATAAVVAGRVHRRLALQLDHLLRLVGLWLSAALGWRGTHTDTHFCQHQVFLQAQTQLQLLCK